MRRAKPEHVSEIRVGPVMWLMGVRVVQRGPAHVVIRVPIWATENAIGRAAAGITKDAALLGRKIEVTVGHRLVHLYEARRRADDERR